MLTTNTHTHRILPFTLIMADLTVDNFIMKIKDMQPRERKHLRVEDLVKLIIQLTDTQPANNCDEVMNSINEMMITLTQVQKLLSKTHKKLCI